MAIEKTRKAVAISIVTPCLNRVDFIENAIMSVIDQNLDSYEHIVVDGGSTDGTLEVLKKYPSVRYISEKDDNLYQALNKAIKMANGKVIGHLNSDDSYPPGVLNRVLEEFHQDPTLESVFGYSELVDFHKGQKRLLVKYENTDLSLRNITVGVANTNARFFSDRAYEKIGLYNEDYHIASDREFLLRAFNAELHSKKLPETVYEYVSHSGSLTISGNGSLHEKTAQEYLHIAEIHLAQQGDVEQNKWLRLWVIQTCTAMVIRFLKSLNFFKAMRYFLKGTQTDTFFLIRLLSEVVSGKLAVLRNRLGFGTHAKK